MFEFVFEPPLNDTGIVALRDIVNFTLGLFEHPVFFYHSPECQKTAAFVGSFLFDFIWMFNAKKLSYLKDYILLGILHLSICFGDEFGVLD